MFDWEKAVDEIRAMKRDFITNGIIDKDGIHLDLLTRQIKEADDEKAVQMLMAMAFYLSDLHEFEIHTPIEYEYKVVE